ncbi:LysR family transcriptional regulator ArgP [Uliginosibacterium sp. 31-16]|uniref:LysR family transcriptional regulator ArgP n=1 Tax=Uliginosibacterium sp. 31-16 TaxID=3068315 RepID=UPI00273FD31E|nr:LysR family transcriptional regulator ArgP [Uliginosibacterium sp. 31-16]MDP5239571.1 LysR family transcriptional regulator ArgP [Uliginosibacterium sp. 31-16]
MNVDFSLLACLEAVVTEGSFDKAASVLSITQSAVSQRIRALESQIGLPLLFRTRPVKPTPAAQPLLRFARQTRLLAMEVWPEVLEGATHGQLRLAVNADSLGTWVLPALTEWMDQHAVTLEFVVDDQTLTQARLRNGEVIGSIGSDPVAAKGFSVVPLGEMAYVCAAAPAFVRRYFPRGLELAAARKAPALVFNRRDALQADHLSRCLNWHEPRFPHHFVPAFEAYLQAAVLGYGYGMMPLLQCQSALDAGLLVNVTPDVPVSVPLYWHTWQLESELIGSLGKALVAGAMQALAPISGDA